MLLLDAPTIASTLDYDACANAVEDAFRQHGRGAAPNAAVCGVRAGDGGFHVKIAALGVGDRPYVASKTNANFPRNPGVGLPTIQGVIALFDAARGTPLALLDSGEITVRRTAATTVVAAKRLARPDSATLAVCGCGVQGRAHIEALCRSFPIERVFACDADDELAARAAREAADALGVNAEAVADFRAHARRADICVTCTSSRAFVLGPYDVRPGAFVAGVGVDDPRKRELEPRLLARGLVVADVLDQCARIGDLHHAEAAGALSRASVYGELGEVVAGAKAGRSSAEQIFIFDSTGTALEDVAAAALAYERARGSGVGTEVRLA